ncbi:unnamed protein product [Rotaria magnacalcarata]|uniref:Uncharacterized protein n=1 Tax=Rotaria magnacalcarata TaxID=392030 RepID=A0A819SL48_9BILA|nr:unnamed protein product [Rotaria magnacalcarata]CAF1675649.1 unnamed protein product [Rotaria magnacalcarata]CAF2120315.1 unnamed protein product [Rotaria magnacalcarata]CAF3778374.1 unnamed protein product [Rotaria magnacalcarata]CAF3803521.1 unnamed protein product [Rotaria magnacalcarata]
MVINFDNTIISNESEDFNNDQTDDVINDPAVKSANETNECLEVTKKNMCNSNLDKLKNNQLLNLLNHVHDQQ